jgi:hypothetical protein
LQVELKADERGRNQNGQRINCNGMYGIVIGK